MFAKIFKALYLETFLKSREHLMLIKTEIINAMIFQLC